MNRIFRHRIFTGMALAGVLFLGSSCNDEWDDHYDAAGVNSNQTILEIISSDADLSDFKEVVEACGVADSLLGNSRVYTLWAPTNGHFDKGALLSRIQNGERDKVLVQFVEAHLSNYLHAANGQLEDNHVLLLNKKVVPFEGTAASYSFDGIPVITSNVRARNGIVHKLDGSVQYQVNIYEYLETDSRLDSLRNYLYSFDVTRFNEYLSVAGPTVNGEITYIDSVFTNSNMWFTRSTYTTRELSGFGDLISEDSTYIMFAPTNEAWNKILAVSDGFYNYHKAANLDESDIVYLDSLRWQHARKPICNYLVFSDNEQKYVHPDSLFAAFAYSNNQMTANSTGTVYKTFAKDMLMDGVIDTVELSNGKIYITDKFNYSPYDLWFDTLKIEADIVDISSAEDYYSYSASTVEGLTTVYLTDKVQEDNKKVEGKLSNNSYAVIPPKEEASRPQITYKIPNTLSGGKYRIGVVIVPPQLADTTITDIKPTKIRAQLSAMTSDGEKKTVYDTNNGSARWNGLQNNPAKIDTVYLYDLDHDKASNGDITMRVPQLFGFDFCEFGVTEAKKVNVELQLTCDLQKKTDSQNFERTLRIDCIILEPVYEEATEDESDTVAGEESGAEEE